jgi:hypothetical protein
MGPAGCRETSITNCQSTLRNFSEDRSDLHRTGSLKSRKFKAETTLFNNVSNRMYKGLWYVRSMPTEKLKQKFSLKAFSQ